MSIRRGFLSDLFEGVAVKKLSVVETRPSSSNQHEFNGSAALRRLFRGDDRLSIPTRFVRLDQEQGGISEDAFVSWYDARRNHPTRSEYRLYYKGNAVTELMNPGDVFFLALRRDGTAMIFIAPAESTVQRQLSWLFGLEDQPGFQFSIRDQTDRGAELDYAARFILDELGVDFEEREGDRLDEILQPFGPAFPTTRIFSELARKSLPGIDPRDGADAALVAWLEREEMLFRRMERRIVAERLRTGFVARDEADVDGFIAFSLSVQNRRKSRAGQSLEHHLEHMFRVLGVRFARGVETEEKYKPDFLFPGQAEYRDEDFPAGRLTMLGAKSTLKERWRQVLSEARRIQTKHLMTLEPGISLAQTAQMRSERIQLVLPAAVHCTFRPEQQGWLMDLEALVRLLQERQQ